MSTEKKEDFPQGKSNGKPSQYIPNLPSAMISTIKNRLKIIADFTGLPISLIAGWWLTYPSEKYESQLGFYPNIWKHKKCPKPPTRWKGPSTRVSSAALNTTLNGSVSKPCTPGEHQNSW
jgi:hypothetical protein